MLFKFLLGFHSLFKGQILRFFMEVIARLIIEAQKVYSLIDSVLPPWFSLAVLVFFAALALALMCLFLSFFYSFICKRDLLKLSLNQYNYSDHPVLKKVFAIGLYILEYVIVLPFFIFLSFVFMSVTILIISYEGQTVDSVLLISASMILAIRLLAYTNKSVSKELSSLFPYSALFIFLLTPNIVSVERLIAQANEIPLLFDNILSFLGIILVVEILLRIMYVIQRLFISESKREASERNFSIEKL